MRFYCKLIILIALAVSAQRYLFAGDQLGEFWFGLRCDIAYTMHDRHAIERLTDEAHQRYDFPSRVNASSR